MAIPTSRETLADYCLKELGAPVIEINVSQDQLEDRIDEALQVYQEFHSDATIRTYVSHQITSTDISNRYIPIASDILFVSKVFPISANFGHTRNFFDAKYQLMLNDITNMHNYIGDLAYYEQLMQYLTTLDMKLNGVPQVNFSRHQDRLYIYGDFNDGDIIEGDYIVFEAYVIVDPDLNTSVYNDRFVKQYTTQLIKRQWGTNLKKFEGMQLPGGLTFSGQQLYDEANQEIERLEEKMRLEHELPPDFFVG